MLIISILVILWCMYWSAESGASLPWSHKWQTSKFLQKLPEILLAITVSVTSCYTFQMIPWYYLGPVAAGVSFAGIEAATWAMLRWYSHDTPNLTRSATIKPLVDLLARPFGYTVGDEGYAWVWASVKGLIITLPVGGTGFITFPLANELGSHARGRLPGDSNMWKELAGGLGIGISCLIAILIA